MTQNMTHSRRNAHGYGVFGRFVVGSNPVTPTKSKTARMRGFLISPHGYAVLQRHLFSECFTLLPQNMVFSREI